MPKQTTIRLTENTKDQLQNIWGTTTEGVERASAAYINLRQRVLHDLRGVFTREELAMLVDIQNGTMVDPSYMANVDIWRSEIEDAIKFESADQNWNVDSAQLFEKIDELHEVYVYFFREEIDRFWKSGDSIKIDSMNLEGFLNKYAKN